jgi:hypothetical protein
MARDQVMKVTYIHVKVNCSSSLYCTPTEQVRNYRTGVGTANDGATAVHLAADRPANYLVLEIMNGSSQATRK